MNYQKEKGDDCDPNPCKNGGTCLNKKKGYKCKCPPGFKGKNCQKEKGDDCDPNPCKNGGTCINKKKGYKCKCPPGFKGKNCQKEKGDDCDPNPCKNGGTCLNKKKGYKCKCPPGFKGKNCQKKKDPHDICETERPCKNGGTCTNEEDGSYKCCCPEEWTGPTCEERELPRKPPGPHLECIMHDDPKGLMYFGTQSYTTSGRKCQPWASRYPHEHAYHKILAEEENYCRNRLHGTKGLKRPWCYTMDRNKKWEYCDTIPKCSDPNMTFPEPPENPGCYKRSDKGESYKGPVWFAANGLRCLKWDNYPDNFCRNPFGMRKKPWCWTQFGKEDCDIDICALPPPVPGEDACAIDTSVSVCTSTIKLRGDCYFRHRLYEECDFTVVTISSLIYDVYMPDVIKELHWRGIDGQERYTSHACKVTFEVSDYNEMSIKFPLCGWCATKTFKSYMNDVNNGTKTCPVP